MKNNRKNITERNRERSPQEILHALEAEISGLCCDSRVTEDIAQRLLDALCVLDVVAEKYRKSEPYYELAHQEWRKSKTEGE